MKGHVCSDVSPPPRRSRVTHMDREDSVPLDGHGTCMWRSVALGGARRVRGHGACAHVSAKETRCPSEGQSLRGVVEPHATAAAGSTPR